MLIASLSVNRVICLNFCVFKHSLFQQCLVDSFLPIDIWASCFHVEECNLDHSCCLLLQLVTELEVHSTVIQVMPVDLLLEIVNLRLVHDELPLLIDFSRLWFLLLFHSYLIGLLLHSSVPLLKIHLLHSCLESLHLSRMVVLFTFRLSFLKNDFLLLVVLIIFITWVILVFLRNVWIKASELWA